MLIATLIGPFGRMLIRKAKSQKQRIYSWTVNDEKTMDWCIRHELDGVITDNPAKFLDVCERFKEHEKPSWPVPLLLNFLRINFFAIIFTLIFWRKYGYGFDTKVGSSKKQR